MPDEPLIIDEISFGMPRLVALERRVDLIANLLSGLTLGGIFADITLSKPNYNNRLDKIEKRRRNCKVTVAVDVQYDLKSSRQETDAQGKVVRTCNTYEITTTTTISEVCEAGTAAQNPKTSKHVSRKEFCSGTDGDAPKTGETVDFNGDNIDTLTYPHGTKITVKQSGDTITVTITYSDGTSVSTGF